MHPLIVYATTTQHLRDLQREASQAQPGIRADASSLRPARRRWRALAATLRLPGYKGGAAEPAL